MKNWSLEFLPESEKDLIIIESRARQRIINKLSWFLKNFSEITLLPLAGEFKYFYKLRIGDWRVMYKIDWQKKKIFIFYIERRDKIYKKQ